jgi:hypothetical protein
MDFSMRGRKGCDVILVGVEGIVVGEQEGE